MQRVIFEEEYPDPLAVGILTTAGVELWRWDPKAKVARRVENPNTFEQAQDELRRRHREGTLVPAPRPGQLPMHTGTLPTARPPPAPAADDAAEGEADEAEAELARRAGIRDLTTDPHRQETLRRLAREKAERRKRQQEEAKRGE
jgi:hypothetical protein